ncbi:MAG: mitochondrial fission ELM1 family protein [Asticcacaulis sp.]
MAAAASEPEPRKLTLWAVSDGRAGIANQVLGLAEAVARLVPADIVVKTLRYAPAFERWPTALWLWPDAMTARDSDPVAPPWPDIWIAAGRATLPHSRRMRARSHGRTLVVQLQDPGSVSAFDLVIAPEHDGVSGGNTLSIVGSTHRVTREKLADEGRAWAGRIGPLPHPRIAALIGGTSKTHDLGPARAEAIAVDIRRAVEQAKGSLLLSLSRRTPDAARRVLTGRLNDLPGIIYDGDGANPYFAFLDAADHILVTEDSVNMATEAAATGKPVHILATDRVKPGGKFDAFHQSLRQRGTTRPFTGSLDVWTYDPLDETARAARKVIDVFNGKYPDRSVKA